MNVNLGDLIPDFEPLLSSNLLDYEAGLDTATTHKLAPVFPTFRAISLDPSILSKAMLDYISLVRNAKVMRGRETLEKECAILATKHSDLIVASRAVHGLHSNHELSPSKTFIHSLPVEILAFILTRLMNPQYPTPFEDVSKPFDMKVRAVCRRWLHVIESTSALWTRLVFKSKVDNFDSLHAVLKRSKDAPLELTIDIKSMENRLCSVLLPEIVRTRVLCLECFWYISNPTNMTDRELRAEYGLLEDLMLQLAKKPAPLLEALKLVSWQTMSTDVFSRTTPSRLRSLYIRFSGPVSPACWFFKSVHLTTLIIEHCEIWETIDDMLDLLSTLPNLQCLIWNTLHNDDDIPFLLPHSFGHKSVHLVHLTQLDLVLPLEIIALVIPIVDVPNLTELIVRNTLLLDESDCISPDFASMTSALHSSFRPYFKNLLPEDQKGYDDMSINLLTECLDEQGFSVTMKHQANSFTNPLPSFTFGLHCDDKLQEEYMDILMQTIGWIGRPEDVTNLSVSHSDFMHEEPQWGRLLDQLPQLVTVDVSEACALAFFRALYTNAVPSSQFTATLQNICVHGVGAIAC